MPWMGPVKPSIWDDPLKVEELRRLAELRPSLTCREIGERLGTGRNSVIGKMYRLKLGQRENPQKKIHIEGSFARPPLKPVERKPPTKSREPADIFFPKTIVPLPAKYTPPAPGANATPFIDATPSQCRFPLWQHHERIGKVCGNPVIPGISWCPACLDRVKGGAARCETTGRLTPRSSVRS